MGQVYCPELLRLLLFSLFNTIGLLGSIFLDRILPKVKKRPSTITKEVDLPSLLAFLDTIRGIQLQYSSRFRGGSQQVISILLNY